MRKICFITGTRADYGIMVPLMRAVKESDDAQLQVIATNMHLSQEYGMTVNEIIADGFDVDARIDSLLSGDSPAATVKSMGLTQIGMADAFERLRPDLAVILGDRYEMLAAASAALIFRIPVAHLYGGETTEGAYDDCIRHAITKLSSLHFTSTELYARRIIQMGEEPDRVFHVGSLGAQSIREEKGLPLQELEKAIDFRLGEKYVVATFHPVTTQPGEEERQTSALLSSLDKIIAKGWRVLFTMPNSDTGGTHRGDNDTPMGAIKTGKREGGGIFGKAEILLGITSCRCSCRQFFKWTYRGSFIRHTNPQHRRPPERACTRGFRDKLWGDGGRDHRRT